MHRSPTFARSVLEAMEESVIVTDSVLDDPGPRIVYVNAAFERITGYRAAEVIGRSPRILQGERTDPNVRAEMRRSLMDRTVFRGSTINYRKDGTPFVNDWRILPIEIDGMPHFLAIQRDVTEERHLYALAQITSSAESHGLMVAGLRHELGNPINSLKAAVYLLRNQFKTLPFDRTDRYLAAMQKELGRLEHLLAGLRTMNAFEAPQPRWFQLDAEVRSLYALMAPLLREHGIEWMTQIDSKTLVFADPNPFHQILINVIKNAVEASKGGGRIEIIHAPEERTIAIRDTGHGISEERLRSLFSPFITTKQGGSGLGLYVARRLAADMHCQLSVSSVVGVGTTVTLTFPPSGPDTDPPPT